MNRTKISFCVKDEVTIRKLFPTLMTFSDFGFQATRINVTFVTSHADNVKPFLEKWKKDGDITYYSYSKIPQFRIRSKY